jgi:hypothetical protein
MSGWTHCEPSGMRSSSVQRRELAAGRVAKRATRRAVRRGTHRGCMCEQLGKQHNRYKGGVRERLGAR